MDFSMSALQRLHQAIQLPGQPTAFYAALTELLASEIGFEFVTIFVIDGGQTLRVYSTQPDLYPVGERKPMASTPWGDHVLRQHRSFLAKDTPAVEQTFFDHERIASLGCGAVLSVPVVFDGRCLGVLNLNGREHAYNDNHVANAEIIAPSLTPIFLDAIHAMREGAKRRGDPEQSDG